jgi:hypothetical protein
MVIGKFPVFTGSDAWLILSIAMGDTRKGSSLRDIIAVGDYINHAIFTGAELRRGLSKLLHAGYIREEGERFLLSGRKVKAGWKKILKTKRPVLRMWDEWEKFLGVPDSLDPAPYFEDPEWLFPAVTDDKVWEAYEEYLAGYHQGKPAAKKTGGSPIHAGFQAMTAP